MVGAFGIHVRSYARLLLSLLFCLLCSASACVAILEGHTNDEPPEQGSPKGTTNSRPAVPWCVLGPQLLAWLVKISGQGEEAAEPHAHGWSDPACEDCLPPMHDVRRTHVDMHMAAVPLSRKISGRYFLPCGMLPESASEREREYPINLPATMCMATTDDSAWPSACKRLLGPCLPSARCPSSLRIPTHPPSRCLCP
ncbi:hypothetical protein COCMIDRAFT_35695 [Bipolaris oryzae ATCC 44560]|uniref:C2H2-type domain-containing protein n=1 Tax=Bipolaris oryzae ATCC 44560 TaxID=930090 RepID=W6ZAA4_COCMI|nr:uncharacterized protein COCMIDRAFT_35695 [Bipolaris oryzae ATCC 44560]EUC46703.1 hypothetical protein COCMIDRAFT_35695 [Bipolaris oryzae ATCC 44560]